VEVEEAKEALRKAVPCFDTYLKNEQIEFISYTHWYLKKNNFDSANTLNSWTEKLNQALTNGYNGLRLNEHTFWLKKEDWNDFINYEEEINIIIENYPIIALCNYALDKCNATEIISVVSNHQFALIKKEGKWERIESSKLKRAEEKRLNLQHIIESLSYAIITKSFDGTITSWNRNAEQIYGYSAKEMLGKHISILEPAILVEETDELIEQLKQGYKIHDYETLRVRKDGTLLNVLLTLFPIFDTSEKLIAISIIAKDATKNKKSNEKLWKNEKIHQIFMDQTDQVMYDYDLRTGKCDWSGSIEKVTGYGFEELKKLGTEFWIKNIHHADINHMNEKLQYARITEGKFKEEASLIRKDGTCIYIENSGICLTDHEDRPYGSIGVLKDITSIKLAEKRDPIIYIQNEVIKNEENVNVRTKRTTQDIAEHKIAEETLRLKLEELSRSNAQLEQFAYVSSHDLQEPLRMITSYLQLLQRKYQGNLDDKADQYINFAVDGASRMQNLINDLLRFSRVTTSIKEPEPTDCEIILNQVLSNLELAINENNATITHDPLPEVMGDSTQLGQVFQNLIINGIKFQGEEIHQKFISRLRKKRMNGCFQFRTTELELIHNIQKEFSKCLKDYTEKRNILEQE
jgi:PAS domain S-box-containing protein